MLWSIPTGFILLRVWPHQPLHRRDRGHAHRRGHPRLAAGQGRPGRADVRPGRRRPGPQARRWPRPGPPRARARGAAPAPAARAGHPGAPVTAPGPGRRAALRRARRARPPGRRAAAPAADLGRGRHGRAGRDDRADAGQGAGPLDRRLHRGGPAAGRGRRHHGQADAALRLPRPAGHREDHRGPGAGQDLLRLRPAGDARGRRGAPGRPGRRVPGRDRDQDQRAGRLRARRGAVHRRGLQPGQRGRRADRPVRRRGGPDAAQAGRGQPRGPDHHPGRVREADGGLPGLQPRPGLPVRHPAEVPELLPGGDAGAGRVGAGPPRRAARPGRAAGAVADVRGGRPPPDRRRARQRPVRPQPAGEGGPGPRRAGDDRLGRARPGGPDHASAPATCSRPTPS